MALHNVGVGYLLVVEAMFSCSFDTENGDGIPKQTQTVLYCLVCGGHIYIHCYRLQLGSID